MENFNIDAFKTEFHKLGVLQKASFIKKVLKGAKNAEMQHQAEVYEYILAIVLPPVGVGLHTNWQTKPLVSNILWCCLAYVPGVVHAFIVYNKY